MHFISGEEERASLADVAQQITAWKQERPSTDVSDDQEDQNRTLSKPS
ncbi:hypothetical protein [Natronococcus wangiae]|nr:hypothetical protein [Natronococcus sp. AD5]